MKVPKPKVFVSTYSESMRLKRRHAVYIEEPDGSTQMVLARFVTLPEAESFAKRVKSLLQSVGLERRDDGQVVPRERWENGIRSIATVIGWVSKSFEVREVVDRVERIYKLAIKAGVKECFHCGELELSDDENERTWIGKDCEGRPSHQRCAVKYSSDRRSAKADGK